MYSFGLIMGSQDKETRRLPVDDDQLPKLHNALNNTLQTCLFGLNGIGGLISISRLELEMPANEWQGLGMVIQNLSLLAQEAQSHMETVTMQMEKANQINKDDHHGF